MSEELQGLVKLLGFVNKFKNILRTVNVANSSPRRFENDAEHSFELAMAAWYLNQKSGLGLDSDKLIKYSLVHDLVEVYAGDIDPFLFPGQDITQVKAENEHSSLQRINSEFSDFPDMLECIKSYEAKADEESKFVYALDKIICDIGITEIDGITEKQCGISQQSLQRIYDKKVSKSGPVHKLGLELMEIYKQRQKNTGEFYAEVDFVPEFKLDLFAKQQKLVESK